MEIGIPGLSYFFLTLEESESDDNDHGNSEIQLHVEEGLVAQEFCIELNETTNSIRIFSKSLNFYRELFALLIQANVDECR